MWMLCVSILRAQMTIVSMFRQEIVLQVPLITTIESMRSILRGKMAGLWLWISHKKQFQKNHWATMAMNSSLLTCQSFCSPIRTSERSLTSSVSCSVALTRTKFSIWSLSWLKDVVSQKLTKCSIHLICLTRSELYLLTKRTFHSLSHSLALRSLVSF